MFSHSDLCNKRCKRKVSHTEIPRQEEFIVALRNAWTPRDVRTQLPYRSIYRLLPAELVYKEFPYASYVLVIPSPRVFSEQ